MTFISSSRFNPCPCCHDISGKCRTRETSFSLPNGSSVDDTQLFCMNSREDTNNYKFTGETSDQLWGKFISFDLSQLLSESWQSVKQKANSWKSNRNKRTVKRPPVLKKRDYSHLLLISNRHQEITQLLAQLTIEPHHHKALLERGFTTEQIERYGFRSVSYQQPLKTPISNHLAGVAPGGRNLTNKFSGLIVPVRDADDNYLGFQYRLDNPSDSRYLWAKSGKYSSHLSEYSKLPLAFCFPDGGVKDDQFIALTESPGFKPQLTANHRGLITLGASGGLFASSPKQLKSYLDKASSILQCKSVLFFPDAHAVKNHQVLKRYKRTTDLLTKLGYSVQFAWWGQINKSDPDPDEYKGDYQIISIEQFFSLGLQYSAFYPNKHNRNAVQDFLDLLTNHKTNNLKAQITAFKSQYQHQFDLIKRISWRHLEAEQKRYVHSLCSQ